MDLWLVHDPLLPMTRNIVTEAACDQRLAEPVRALAKELLNVHFADGAD